MARVGGIQVGASIPAARPPHLFRRYAGVGMGAAAGDRANGGGSGFGLVICGVLVEAHGGRIRAERAGPGRGARIIFMLPAAEEASASVSAAPPAWVSLAQHRRTAAEPFRVGELEIDRMKRQATTAGCPVRPTETERRLLLSLDAGGVNTYEALQRRVWGPGKGDPQTVTSAVTKLRRKLGDDARSPRYVLGERGHGHRMPEPDDP